MKKILSFLLLSILLFGIIFSGGVVFAQTSQSANFKIQLDSLNFGGPDASSSNYSAKNTQGEVGTGVSSSSNFSSKAGFRQAGGFACSDGIDNDGDGLVDFPADLSCESLLDDDESDIAIDGGGGGGGNNPEDPQVPVLSCSISATPSSIILGESVLLSWSSFNYQNGGEIFPLVGPVVANGTVLVSPLTSTFFTAFFTIGTKQVSCNTYVEVLTEELETGVLSFANNQITVNENTGSIAVAVKRMGGQDGQLSATITPGFASASSADFTVQNSVVFEDGEAGTKNILLSIINDSLEEGNEVFTLELATDDLTKRENPFILTVNILDDDAPEPQKAGITLIKEVIGGNRTSDDFDFRVGARRISSGESVSVDANRNINISEIGPDDYEFLSVNGSVGCPSTIPGSINLEEGQNIVCIVQNIFKNEPIILDPEIINPEIIDPENPTNPQNPIPITNNLFSPANDSFTLLESDGFLEIPISPNFIIEDSLTIEIQSISGTALPGLDYFDIDQEIFWTVTDTGQRNIRIDILNDRVAENQEGFSVVVKTKNGQVLKVYNVTIIDDDSCEGLECQEPRTEISSINFENILGSFSQLRDSVENIFTNNNSKPVIQTIATAGAVAGALSLASVAFSSPLSLGEIFMLPFRIWSLILMALGIKKRSRPWGIVYDSQTKQPLDPVYVSLLDENGKEVASSITDLDGRYGFLVKPGVYTLSAKKTHYEFPSKKLNNASKDELYDDLYYGEKIEVKKDGEVFAKNIPMDQIGFDWNEYAKKGMKVMRFHVRNSLFIARLIQVLFVVGFIIAALAYIFAPQPYNVVIFAFYLVMLLIRFVGLKVKKVGKIKAIPGNKPLSYAVVKILSSSTGVQIAKRVCDQNGHYFALVGPGVYDLDIEQKLPDGTYKKVFSIKKVPAKKGIINKTFLIPL